MEATRARTEGRSRGARHQAHAARLHHPGLRPGTAGVSALLRVAGPAGRRTRVHSKYVHIGFAADTPRDSSCPSSAMPTEGRLRAGARTGALSEKARAGKLAAAEMQGGCFTVSSLGGIGGTAFTPIINAPEVAILGVSKREPAARVPGRRVRAAADAAAVAVLRSSRDRRCHAARDSRVSSASRWPTCRDCWEPAPEGAKGVSA